MVFPTSGNQMNPLQWEQQPQTNFQDLGYRWVMCLVTTRQVGDLPQGRLTQWCPSKVGLGGHHNVATFHIRVICMCPFVPQRLIQTQTPVETGDTSQRENLRCQILCPKLGGRRETGAQPKVEVSKNSSGRRGAGANERNCQTQDTSSSLGKVHEVGEAAASRCANGKKGKKKKKNPKIKMLLNLMGVKQEMQLPSPQEVGWMGIGFGGQGWEKTFMLRFTLWGPKPLVRLILEANIRRCLKSAPQHSSPRIKRCMWYQWEWNRWCFHESVVVASKSVCLNEWLYEFCY